MQKQKTTLSFTEARLEIESVPSYEYEIYIRDTGETRKARCAGGESYCLISANARALSLLEEAEKQSWQNLEKRKALERVYKAFPPELRYIHEHPVLDSWKSDAKAVRSQVLSPDMACLRVAVDQLLNHGIKKERAFELLARILPELAPQYFEKSRNLKADTDNLRKRHEESDSLLNSAKEEAQKNLTGTPKKDLNKSQERYDRLMDEGPLTVNAEKEIFNPLPEELDFGEIEAWTVNEIRPAEEKFALAETSEET